MNKRKLAVLLSIGIMIASLAGCGSDNEAQHIKLPFLQQEPSIESFYGNFYNMAYLQDSVFDTVLTIGDSESFSGGLHIFGYSAAGPFNYLQTFDVDIPMPEGDTFSFYEKVSEIGLTITLHPEDHTLEIVQQPKDDMTPYTGSYVDGDVWSGLVDERRAAYERYQALTQPNRWINDYAGYYVLETFADGEEDALNARFDIGIDDYDSQKFYYTPSKFEQGSITYKIPYPMVVQDSNHIEYETIDGLVAFDVLDDKEDGRHVIRIIESPHLACTGIFVSGAENLDSIFEYCERRLNWPGNYFCDSDGKDGTKSISIFQVNDRLLSIDLVHNYADGRVETYHADAEVNAYGNGPYYALSVGEKWVDFKLQVDPDTGRKVVRVEQNGITVIDPEFQGTYFREP